MGINGTPSIPPCTPVLTCCLDGLHFSHSFLVIPSCPVPLLGQDILSKLGASIHLPAICSSPSPTHLLLTVITDDTDHSLNPHPDLPVDPVVWDASTPTIATHHQPVLIKLKNPSQFPSRPQYPISHTHRLGLKPIIDRLLKEDLLIPCHSPCNTPILPVKKPNGSYRLVQDLRIINEAVIPIHPVVPNPYTILSPHP